MSRKDTFHAKIAFYLSLGFWVPLFNLALCLTSLIIAIKTLNRYFKDPKIGGLGYIITALILSLSGIILTIIGLVFFLLSEDVCGRGICLAYYETL